MPILRKRAKRFDQRQKRAEVRPRYNEDARLARQRDRNNRSGASQPAAACTNAHSWTCLISGTSWPGMLSARIFLCPVENTDDEIKWCFSAYDGTACELFYTVVHRGAALTSRRVQLGERPRRGASPRGQPLPLRPQGHLCGHEAPPRMLQSRLIRLRVRGPGAAEAPHRPCTEAKYGAKCLRALRQQKNTNVEHKLQELVKHDAASFLGDAFCASAATVFLDSSWLQFRSA